MQTLTEPQLKARETFREIVLAEYEGELGNEGDMVIVPSDTPDEVVLDVLRRCFSSYTSVALVGGEGQKLIFMVRPADSTLQRILDRLLRRVLVRILEVDSHGRVSEVRPEAEATARQAARVGHWPTLASPA